MRLRIDPGALGYSYHQPSAGFGTRLRAVLAQFSDYFSEFNRFIAPTYYHDRCERTVQMRLYSMHKRELFMVFVAFFTCFGLGVFVGLAGPPMTTQTEVRGSRLLHDKHGGQNANVGLATGPFFMRTPSLSAYSQRLWVIAQIQTDNVDEDLYDKAFQISVTAHGLTTDHKPVIILLADDSHNRTRHLHCHRDHCDELLIMHLESLVYTHYMLEVHFHNLASHSYNIKEVTFYFKTLNPDFTQIEIWFRFIFLVTTFMIMMGYAHALRRYPSEDWSNEQRWLSMLLPLLLFFNDPIFPLIFLTNSWLPGMLDAVFQATFLCALLLFWLCIYHGLRQRERHWISFYGPKFVIVGALWISAVILATWQLCDELNDPTYNYKLDVAVYNAYKAFFLAVSGIYAMYLLTLMLKAYTDLRSMPFFDMRLRFLTVFLMVVVSVTLYLMALRYGAGVLEDDFLSELRTTYSSSAHFMCFYGLLNFYVYAMAYVYSPAYINIQDEVLTKDNPAFSMINESDEDVIYGSEDECRRPLSLTRCNDADDSD